MTQLSYEYIACPFCADECERPLFSTIDLKEDPDLLERILKKEINAYNCLNCGHEFVEAAPLLVIANEYDLVIKYDPLLAKATIEDLGIKERFIPNSEEALKWQEQQIANENALAEAGTVLDKQQIMSNRLNQALPPSLTCKEVTERNLRVRNLLPEYLNNHLELADLSKKLNCQFRLVLEYNDLIEKLQIAKQNFDDRLIELIKLVTIKSIANNQASALPERLYFVHANSEALLFFTYDANGWDYLDLPLSTYTNCLKYVDYLSLPNRLALVDISAATDWWEQILEASIKD